MSLTEPCDKWGINRNILECKDGQRVPCKINDDCINRNILECKGSCANKTESHSLSY